MTDRTRHATRRRRRRPRIAAWLAAQLGRRGAVLALLGLAWLMQGIGLAADPDRGHPPAALFLFHAQLPAALRAAGWLTTGAVALVCAFYPPERRGQALGYAAVFVMPGVRLASYAIAWVVGMLPLDGYGWPGAWAGVVTWAAIVGVILVVSGWPEPAEVPSSEVLRRGLERGPES